MLAIFKKDLKSAFNSVIGWILCAFMVLILGIYFSRYPMLAGSTNFGYVLSSMIFVLLVFVPLLTMRSVVEERRQKTDQLLLTSPVSIRAIVWGKYLALLTVYAIPLVIAAFCPLIMNMYGDVNLAWAYSCLLAFFLMGAACIAIGLFISTLTENQIIAALLTFGVFMLMRMMTTLSMMIPASAIVSVVAFTLLLFGAIVILYQLLKNVIIPAIIFIAGEAALIVMYVTKPALLEGAFGDVIAQLALFDRFAYYVNGLFDVTGIVYFISIALLFVFLTRQSFEKRRWN